MRKQITIGGNRLGSGSGMKTGLNGYGRSTHNLREKFTSTLAPGVLVPFYNNIAVNGDTFDIDLQAMMRTIPTKGPLFGSFKLQLDMFSVPIRLYNAILHNNPINIGLNMKHVKFPKIELNNTFGGDFDNGWEFSQIASNSLLKYLGISGLGNYCGSRQTFVQRRFNATGILAYYDIFKNYYANKQEENAYYIGFKNKSMPAGTFESVRSNVPFEYDKGNNIITLIVPTGTTSIEYRAWVQFGGNANKNNIRVEYEKGETFDQNVPFRTEEIGNETLIAINSEEYEWGTYRIIIEDVETPILALKEFPLKNIDEVRMDILSQNTIDDNEYVISDTHGQSPYGALCESTSGKLNVSRPMFGLCLKTYQSDLFNNWLDSELIDGDNGIAAITTIDTSDGLNMDALNLAQKVYNMLNKIVAHGNTYEDWQEAVYSEEAVRRAESPIYIGGMSSEIVFDEVVAAAATDGTELGSLAGRGNLLGGKGGKMVVKVKEPSYIMGIVSITPRLNYSQGNAWYVTELDSIDDLHKPALDGIGYQNLMGEQLAWWSVNIDDDGNMYRDVVGKVPAWINYMTAIDKVYGEFADNRKLGYMVLKRDYGVKVEKISEDAIRTHIDDVTTYIDPSKYNYAFAYDQLDAQNFWCQIMTNVVARRVMSAKMIPNL